MPVTAGKNARARGLDRDKLDSERDELHPPSVHLRQLRVLSREDRLGVVCIWRTYACLHPNSAGIVEAGHVCQKIELQMQVKSYKQLLRRYTLATATITFSYP